MYLVFVLVFRLAGSYSPTSSDSSSCWVCKGTRERLGAVGLSVGSERERENVCVRESERERERE